jgi:stage IV sporulation protein FB
MRKRKYGIKSLKIEFHRTYLVMALGFVLTGHYLNLIVFTSLILVHEMGHYVMAKINKFNVDKIIIYPYGGITKIKDLINRDICEELLVATSGVIVQYLFYLVIVFLYKERIVREYTYNLYTLYSNRMIFFNLLPIYPLDGSKILNLILDKYFPYYKSNVVMMIVSLFMILVIVVSSVYRCSYSNIMVMGLLLTYLYKFYSNRKYLYQKFLLERYLYDIEYPKLKFIGNIRGMFKNKSHIIKINNYYLEEKRVLSNLFSKKRN